MPSLAFSWAPNRLHACFGFLVLFAHLRNAGAVLSEERKCLRFNYVTTRNRSQRKINLTHQAHKRSENKHRGNIRNEASADTLTSHQCSLLSPTKFLLQLLKTPLNQVNGGRN